MILNGGELKTAQTIIVTTRVTYPTDGSADFDRLVAYQKRVLICHSSLILTHSIYHNAVQRRETTDPNIGG